MRTVPQAAWQASTQGLLEAGDRREREDDDGCGCAGCCVRDAANVSQLRCDVYADVEEGRRGQVALQRLLSLPSVVSFGSFYGGGTDDSRRQAPQYPSTDVPFAQAQGDRLSSSHPSTLDRQHPPTSPPRQQPPPSRSSSSALSSPPPDPNPPTPRPPSPRLSRSRLALSPPLDSPNPPRPLSLPRLATLALSRSHRLPGALRLAVRGAAQEVEDGRELGTNVAGARRDDTVCRWADGAGVCVWDAPLFRGEGLRFSRLF